MFEKITPESAGISSGQVQKFIEEFERNKIGLHSLILAKGDQVFAETYWKPFHKDFLHRMYSETKSFVAIAICQLEAEGKLSLDDKIIDYFQDMLPENVHPYLQAQTIRHMLNMQTCMEPFSCTMQDVWKKNNERDRVKTYFHHRPQRYPGTTFSYDSDGSFILGALVERVTGKNFLEYLREKCLDEIGFSQDAHCLKLPHDYLWADSALICKTQDMLRFMRLLARGGEYQGKQLLNRSAVEKAMKKYVDISSPYYDCGITREDGYGYLMWHISPDNVVFHGMHGQFTVYNTTHDITMVCNSCYWDGISLDQMVLGNFVDNIVKHMRFTTLPDNAVAYERLEKYCENRILLAEFGAEKSEFEKEIHGKRFVVEAENPMKISEFTIYFEDNGGQIEYVNAQGKKVLYFGREKNVFQKFP